MLPRSLSFTQIWIWRPAAMHNTTRMCVVSFAGFMKQLLHHLRKSKHNVCPFPDKGVKVEEMIDWVIEEVKAIPDNVW
jgi:hypothetical protein